MVKYNRYLCVQAEHDIQIVYLTLLLFQFCMIMLYNMLNKFREH